MFSCSCGCRIDSLLQQRTGDPEEILTSLGFGSVESNDSLPSRIPERFLTRPSVATGISLTDFLDKNPELKEYVNYRNTLSQPSQSVSSSGGEYGNFSSLQDAINYIQEAEVPSRFYKSFNLFYRDALPAKEEEAPPLPAPPAGMIPLPVGVTEDVTSVQTIVAHMKESDDLTSGVNDNWVMDLSTGLMIPALVESPPPTDNAGAAHSPDVLETNNNSILAKLTQMETGEHAVASPVLSLTSDRAERPDSLDLQPWDDDGHRSPSSDSTVSPPRAYYYYRLTHLSPGESLV